MKCLNYYCSKDYLFIGLYIRLYYELSEKMVVFWFFATNCNDSNIYFDTLHRIVVEFYLSNLFYSILTQLQDCREPWFFLQSLLFGKNAHWKEGCIEGCIRERLQRMDPCGIASQCMKVRIFMFAPTMVHRMQMRLVKRPLLYYLN